MSGDHVVRIPGGGLGILRARLAHRFGSVNTGVYLLIVLYTVIHVWWLIISTVIASYLAPVGV